MKLPEYTDPGKTGVILVDHGSRREESNQLLLEVVQAYRTHCSWPIVEAAHMELAEPSIAQAFGGCVAQGAKLVIVFPYFLSPGRHWNDDIPRLAREAAANHPGVRYLVTAPLGLHELILQVIDHRVATCLDRVHGKGEHCELCDPTSGCVLAPSTGGE